MSWTPITHANTAHEALAAIAELLAVPPEIYGGQTSDPALAVALSAREPGFAMFFAYLYAATREPRWRALAEAHIETAVAAVPQALADRRPFFGYGIAGLAWTLAHLDGWCIDGAVDALDDIDVMIEQLVAEGAVQNFALPKGLVGYGIYALERWPRAGARRLLQQIIERLVERARPRPGGVGWQLIDDMTPPHIRAAFPDGVWLRGAFEGAAGAIALLVAAGRLGVTCKGSAETIESAISFALGDGKPTGVGWAVGDLGIAGLLASSPVSSRALERARALSDPERAAAVDEPGLLGGTAGTCMVFLRLAARTGDRQLRAAALAWFERTLSLFDPQRDRGGFRFWQATWQTEVRPQLETGWIVDPGLFSGAAGVGLALLAATTDIEPRWDRCLLLSTVMAT